MLERMSLCIFQLDKAEKAGAADTWGSRDTAHGEAICSLPVLAGRAADPLRPYPCFERRFLDIPYT